MYFEMESFEWSAVVQLVAGSSLTAGGVTLLCP